MSVTFHPKSGNKSIQAMIDEYLARGGEIRRIENNDVRLKPYQHILNWSSIDPSAPGDSVYSATKRNRPKAPAAYENWPPEDSVVEFVGECPSAPGSSRAKRFEILRTGVTIGLLRSEGLRLADLTRYLGGGSVRISKPSAEPAAAAEQPPESTDDFEGI